MKTYKRTPNVMHPSFLLVQFIVLMAMSIHSAVAADLVKGQSLYQIHCSGCHGEKGISVSPETPSFARGERLFQSDSALIDVVRSGNKAMPAFIGILQDREIMDVITYARTLQW